MPELPEIKRYAAEINKNAAGKIYIRVECLADPLFTPPFAQYRIEAKSRGKELRLQISPVSGDEVFYVTFTHGLVGNWAFVASRAAVPKAARVVFHAQDGSCICYVDVQKMGKWNVGSWGNDRGPDPYDEHEAFRENIMKDCTKPAFELPICEVLLNQKYFNGIGNYLRAEILCRAGISPFTRAFVVFQNQELRERILQLCWIIPHEVLTLVQGLNKYGTPAEKKKFEDWLCCYGKAKKGKDKGGRAVWYFEDQDTGKYVNMGSGTPSVPAVTPLTAATPAVVVPVAVPAAATVAAGSSDLSRFLTEPSWRAILADEFQKPYWKRLMEFLEKEKCSGKKIFPPEEKVFAALNLCPFDKVRVVLLGQDPYHDDGQAMGLSFSVPRGIDPPPSLKNIFKELKSDLGIDPPSQGDLTSWAKQGVLLLNAVLTVRAHEPNSHASMGWETFTSAVITSLNQKREKLVFLLWGGFAQKKASMLDYSKHLILQAGHPSPLSARYFLGCKHFSKTNAYLTASGLPPIQWALDGEPAPPAPASTSTTTTTTTTSSSSSFSSSASKPLFLAAQSPAAVPSEWYKRRKSSLFLTAPCRTMSRDGSAIRHSKEGAPASIPARPPAAVPSSSAQPKKDTAPFSSKEYEEAVTKLSKLLLLLNILYKANRLREEQKSALKDLALKRDPLMFYALEAFEADEDKDLEEVCDTFLHILRKRS